jgi:hypothetical protein
LCGASCLTRQQWCLRGAYDEDSLVLRLSWLPRRRSGCDLRPEGGTVVAAALASLSGLTAADLRFFNIWMQIP